MTVRVEIYGQSDIGKWHLSQTRTLPNY